MDDVFNKMRLALFIRSYGSDFIAKKLKSTNGSLEELILEINNLGRVLNLNPKLLMCFILSDKKPKRSSELETVIDEDEKEKISIYLYIESEISKLVLQKEDKNSLTAQDHERAIVEPAIERVAGNKLSNIADDIEFETKLEELKRNYRNLYYKVAYRYKLPTIRILPFILRLISL